MATDKPVRISKLEAGIKRTWKIHQTLDEMQKWSVYLQTSAVNFQEELIGYSLRSTWGSTQQQQLMDCLETLKKSSGTVKTLTRRLRGPRT